MPRPKKCRRIGYVPEFRKYGPKDRDKPSKDTIILQLDEVEAIRLKDIEKLDQAEGAVEMGVSRQTFQNILESARHKVATSLIEGKELTMEGGHIINKECVAVCQNCGQSYNISKREWNGVCDNCGSTQLYCENRQRRCCH